MCCLAEAVVKILVFVANFICVAAGICLITIGAIVLSDNNGFADAIPDELSNLKLAPILTIVVGSIIFLIAFFGCFGVCIGNPCMLTTYAVFLLVLFLLQVAIGVFAFIRINDKEELDSSITKDFNKIFNDYNKNKEVIDFMQSELKCCGINGKSNYPGGDLPSSCCEDEDKKSCTKFYEKDCDKAFSEFLHSSTKTIGIVVLTISVVEILGCVFSLCMANSIRNEGRRNKYV